MIKSLSTVTHLFPAIAQEGNALPGESLTVIQTITYFVLLPIALFAVIGGLAYVGGRDKKAKKSDVVNSID